MAEALTKEEIAIQALRDIIDPVAKMKRELQEGYVLNHYAAFLGSNAAHLKGRAQQALTAIEKAGPTFEQIWVSGRAFIHNDEGPVRYFYRWLTYQEAEDRPATTGSYFLCWSGDVFCTNQCSLLSYVRNPSEYD